MLTTPSPMMRAGAGEPLLLLHELMFSWHSWGSCIDELSRYADVWAPTLPGHWGGAAPEQGGSVTELVDWIESLLDTEGITSIHVAGNGFGAILGADLLRRRRVRSLTMIAPLGLWPPGTGDARRAADRLIRVHRAAADFGTMASATGDLVRRVAVGTLLGPMSELGDRAAVRDRLVLTHTAPTYCPRVPELLASSEFDRGMELPASNRYAVSAWFGGRDGLVRPPAQDRLLSMRRRRPDIDFLADGHHVPMFGHPGAVVGSIAATLRAVGVQTMSTTTLRKPENGTKDVLAQPY
ncbi:alpha/beta fold hydrolase [Nocardia spumae]|uniref:alpha/beta fold hydrolase n=1 Tax=Nocardia spumae TaxID=2887190 RepID=UPI001D137B38|nr:alpha/beta hydrolase [Nocardia spumae]